MKMALMESAQNKHQCTVESNCKKVMYRINGTQPVVISRGRLTSWMVLVCLGLEASSSEFSRIHLFWVVNKKITAIVDSSSHVIRVCALTGHTTLTRQRLSSLSYDAMIHYLDTSWLSVISLLIMSRPSTSRNAGFLLAASLW